MKALQRNSSKYMELSPAPQSCPVQFAFCIHSPKETHRQNKMLGYPVVGTIQEAALSPNICHLKTKEKNRLGSQNCVFHH